MSVLTTPASEIKRHRAWCPLAGLRAIAAGLRAGSISPYRAAIELRRRCAATTATSVQMARVLGELARICEAIIDEQDGVM